MNKTAAIPLIKDKNSADNNDANETRRVMTDLHALRARLTAVENLLLNEIDEK